MAQLGGAAPSATRKGAYVDDDGFIVINSDGNDDDDESDSSEPDADATPAGHLTAEGRMAPNAAQLDFIPLFNEDEILQNAEKALEKAKAQAAAVQHPDFNTRYGEYRPPWLRTGSRLRSPLLRLHNEVVEFCRLLAPTPAEAAQRQAAMDTVAAVVAELFPSASTQLFGSFATGLYTPTSDIDLVIMNSGAKSVQDALR